MDLPYLYEVDAENCDDIYYVDLELFDVPEMGAAYIVDADRPAIIETGIGKQYQRILDALDALEIARDDIQVISPTHVHLDHAGGTGFLARDCPNATVLTYERGVRHLVDPTHLVAGTKQAVGEQWQYYVEPIAISDDRVRGLEDGELIDLGNHELEVHHAPGHAQHQAIYLDRKSNAVFTADAAGIYVPEVHQLQPTSPPTQFDLEQALSDVEMLRSLHPATLLYTHFGPRTNVEDALSDYEQLLKEWVEEVQQKRNQFEDDEAVIEYFSEHAAMTNVWGEHKSRPEARMNVRGVFGYLDRD